MENLKGIFNARDIAFKEKTLEIFKLINTSLVCVTEFLNSTDPMFNAGIITWEDTNLIDDLIVIIGMVEYEQGTTIEVNGNIISITEENLEYFQRVIHMSLPFDLVITSNENEIMEFLHKLLKDGKGDNFNNIIENAPSSTILEQSSLEFDLTQLSDEQIQALKFNNNKHNKRN